MLENPPDFEELDIDNVQQTIDDLCTAVAALEIRLAAIEIFLEGLNKELSESTD